MKASLLSILFLRVSSTKLLSLMLACTFIMDDGYPLQQLHLCHPEVLMDQTLNSLELFCQFLHALLQTAEHFASHSL
jgi:hypothetical protein